MWIAGRATVSAATLADSKPGSAHRVKIAEALTVVSDSPAAGKGVSATGTARPKAIGISTITTASGTRLIDSVTIWQRPAARSPRQLIAVTIQISAIVANAIWSARAGAKIDRKRTAATARVTLAVHTDIQ